MVDIVEEHLVPAVTAAQHNGHDAVQQGPSTGRVVGQEAVPRQGVGEVRDENPRRGETHTSEERDRKHEAPALAQWAAKRVGAKEPNAGPKACHECAVLEATRNPLGPELLVALASGTLVREVAVPLKCKEGACVIKAEEVDDRNPWNGEKVMIPLVGPLLQSILELLRIPAKLSLHKEVNGAGMVPVVLKHKLLPGQREEVREAVRDVFLPLEPWECSSVHHIMVNVDVLDGNVGEGDAKGQRACPPVIREEPQSGSVADHHQALGNEDECQDVPHVNHLLWRNLGEQERQICWHGIRLVGSGEQPVGQMTSVFGVLRHLHHLVSALRHMSSVRVALIWQDTLHGGDLVVMLILLLELLEVLIGAIENGSLGVSWPTVVGIGRLRQKRGVRRHQRRSGALPSGR
mmetsp:Transcript_59862/g.96921  ORF Transcript_59862/g.96921 Transcript_59862/m.96921 type:complete len:405 (-) Transcript_59862:126-1340(-)